MDGYALRAADGTLGTVLHVIGAAPAGHPFEGTIAQGQAVRLFTGSVVPKGADAILLQEDATAAGTEVTVNEAVTAGRHIRRAGQDFAAGDAVVPAGRRRQPSMARRAPPPACRHPRHRRRDRHAGRTHSSRRHRQFQLTRACRPGARRRR
jgi:molybdopterin molybdotransferase